jgi:hypothetical protein
MASPTQLNITLTTTGNPVITIAIPSALQSLDSTAPGAVQTGYSAVDQVVRAIFRAGVFFDGSKTWYSATQIQSITYQ